MIEIKKAWKKYQPLPGRPEAQMVALPSRERIWPLFEEDLRLQEESLISAQIRPLQERLRADNKDICAANSLGIMLAKNGYFGQAAARFRQVMDLAPQFAGGFSNLGNVMYEQGRYLDAVQYYTEALRLQPQSPEVNVELALTYCEIGQFENARQYYRRAIELNPLLAAP
jgi:Flp pilus assembly protein TadD